jgi:peptidoglycan/xylan/chitin deacetylase (PgdA/CDA1 family)
MEPKVTSRNKVKVFLTVDTEVWDFYDDLESNINSSMWGETPNGNFGLNYLLELFAKYQLSANFFVEPLFSLVDKGNTLQNIVDVIKRYKQDIQLHIHTERLELTNPELPLNAKANLHNYTLKEQQNIIAKGTQLLASCGANNINSFRAGNYGGNEDTLRALNNLGFAFDSTYNACYLDAPCFMTTLGKDLNHATFYGNLTVYPVTYFVQLNKTKRHMQIVATSKNEIIDALNSAYINNFSEVTIVLHSFEAIQRMLQHEKTHRLDKIILSRLEGVCSFLANNRDKFETCLFSSLKSVDKKTESSTNTNLNLKVRNISTIRRLLEQMFRRIF